MKPSGNEIVEGIEERMAELFIEKAGINSVVSLEIVKEVINILGRPEVIDEESAEDLMKERTRLTDLFQEDFFVIRTIK
jgi:predicted nucleic acid-binding protein